MKKNQEFDLSGETFPLEQGFGAAITLSTPDGRKTRIESKTPFATESEASAAMEDTLAGVLAEFKKDGVEVISRNGVPYQ